MQHILYRNLFYRFHDFFSYIYFDREKKTSWNWVCLTNAYSIYLEWMNGETCKTKTHTHSRQMDLLCNDFSFVKLGNNNTTKSILTMTKWKFNCMPNLVFKLVAFLNATRKNNSHFECVWLRRAMRFSAVGTAHNKNKVRREAKNSCIRKQKNNPAIQRVRFDLFASDKLSAYWTRNRTHKKWKLVKLCANWKAVKNGLICMERIEMIEESSNCV